MARSCFSYFQSESLLAAANKIVQMTPNQSVDMDLVNSSVEETVQMAEKAENVEESYQKKEPEILPNDVFKKKMALRVAVFGYLRDRLQNHENPEKSSMIPENVYTTVTDLYWAATDADIDSGAVVTGGTVAAIQFVIKRLSNSRWKFTMPDVREVQDRLEILVGSFGGDAAELRPSFDILVKFAKVGIGDDLFSHLFACHCTEGIQVIFQFVKAE
jgi:hypothetical protein